MYNHSEEKLLPFTVGFVMLDNIFLCAVIWSIALSYEFYNYIGGLGSVYILVDILSGILVPIFLFIFVVLFGIVLDFITIGHIDYRDGFGRLLPSVDFIKGRAYNYWVIEDLMYFPVKKKINRLKHGFFSTVDKNPYTWFLATIILLIMFISFCHLIAISVIDAEFVQDCSNLDNPLSYNCFTTNGSLYGYVQVTCFDKVSDSAMLYCMKFKRLGNVNISSVISIAFAFYLATTAIFTSFFKIVKSLLKVKSTQYWGIAFFVGGALLFIAIVLICILRDQFRIKIRTLYLAEAFAVSFLVVIVGFFLYPGKWWVKLESPDGTSGTNTALFLKYNSATEAILKLVYKKSLEQPLSQCDEGQGKGQKDSEKLLTDEESAV